MKTLRKIRNALAAVSGAIIAAPVKLPPKVVLVAKYVALALGVLEAMDGGKRIAEDENTEEPRDEIE